MLVGEEVWIIDSAAVPAALQPVVNALALALGMSVERVSDGSGVIGAREQRR
jgi:hypothetical protein